MSGYYAKKRDALLVSSWWQQDSAIAGGETAVAEAKVKGTGSLICSHL